MHRPDATAPWTAPPGPLAALALAGVVYLRGWRALRARRPERIPAWRAAAFAAGLAALAVALASPLDVLAARSLTAHMAQHLLLLVVAPPLLLAGAPLVPLVRGLPRPLVRHLVAPVLRAPVVRGVGSVLANPLVGWTAMAVATWAWHVPAAFELALRSFGWHVVEHATFVGAGLCFWWPVVQPWPSRRRWPIGALVPYLLLADVQNTALAALLTFADRPLYPSYALDDQITAGVLMWVPMSIAYLVPAAWFTLRALAPPSARRLALADRLVPDRLR